MQKIYTRINWKNEPSTNTAINDNNLNKMDYAIAMLDDRVIELAGYEERAKQSEENAKLSEEHASISENVTENNAIMSQSYAIGGTGTRENEDVDNAKYYYEQATRVAQGLSGALLPSGTITFEELETSTSIVGYMYNISNDFVTDERFIHSGISYGAGTNIYLTVDGLWDVLTGSNVVSINNKTGVVTLKSSDILCEDGNSVQENIDSLNTNLGNIQIIGITSAEPISMSIPANSSSGAFTISVEAVAGADGYWFQVNNAVPYCYWCITSGTGSNWVNGVIYNPTSSTRSGKVYASALAYKNIK